MVWKFVVQKAWMSSLVPWIERVQSMNAPTIRPAAPTSVRAMRPPMPAAVLLAVP